MRKENDVLKQLIAWATHNDSVRTVVMSGSRANPDFTIDLFSDYDIEIGVDDLSAFADDRKWILCFGEIMHGHFEKKDNYLMCLVLYKDYVRIDFKLYETLFIKKYILENKLPKHWENGFKILMDKDEVTSQLKKPSYNAYIINKPRKSEFIEVVNNFWWDIIYVAKSLWRDELYYAKFMKAHICFSYLKKILDWSIAFERSWNISTNKHGRFFKRLMNAETWDKTENIFAESSIEENWKALFAMIELFRECATAIAQQLNYTYPAETDKLVFNYLQKIKSLDKNATDII